MKVFNAKGSGIKRKFLIAASAYRRMAGKNCGMDFSAEAMREQYLHESRGFVVSSGNGYAYGKKVLDITLSAMREDLARGDFCKNELRSGSCAFVRRYLDEQPVGEFFLWRAHRSRLYGVLWQDKLYVNELIKMIGKDPVEDVTDGYVHVRLWSDKLTQPALRFYRNLKPGHIAFAITVSEAANAERFLMPSWPENHTGNGIPRVCASQLQNAVQKYRQISL
jgi:hypothetical protein